MVNIVSTYVPHANAAQAMNLKVLAERQQAADLAMAQAVKPRQILSPWQGAAQMASSLTAGLQQGAVERQEIAARNELARLYSNIDPAKGPTMQDAALIGRIDSDAGNKIMQDIITNQQNLAAASIKHGYDVEDQNRRIEAEKEAATTQFTREESKPMTDAAKVINNYRNGAYGAVGSPEAMAAANDDWQKATQLNAKPMQQTVTVADPGGGYHTEVRTYMEPTTVGGVHSPFGGGGGVAANPPAAASPAAPAAAPAAAGADPAAAAALAAAGEPPPAGGGGTPAAPAQAPATAPAQAPATAPVQTSAPAAAAAQGQPVQAQVLSPGQALEHQGDIDYKSKGGLRESYSAAASLATKSNDQLNEAEANMKAAGPTGPGTETFGNVLDTAEGVSQLVPWVGGSVHDLVKSGRESLGYGSAEARQAFKQLTLEGIQKQVADYKGSISDKETELFKSMQPGLQNTPDANQRLIDLGRAANERTLLRLKMADAYFAHGGTQMGFENLWNNYVDSHPTVYRTNDNKLVVGTANVAKAKALDQQAVDAFTGNQGSSNLIVTPVGD